jgi:hypothetical protein
VSSSVSAAARSRAAASGRQGARGSSWVIAVAAASQPAGVVGRLSRPVLAGALRRDASVAGAVSDVKRHARADRRWGFSPPAGIPAAWSGAAPSGSDQHGSSRSSRGAGERRVPAIGSTGGLAGVPAPSSPFGPPGRGVVAGAAGVASAVAGSGVLAAILVGGLFVVGLCELRRFRLAPVMAGPVGFVSLLQRPG